MTPYIDLLGHMEWADAHIWTAALNAPGLAHDAGMLERFHHFHSTQWAYLQALLGRPLDIPALSTFADLRAAGVWARRFYRELPALRGTLIGARLDAQVEFPWGAQVAELLGRAAAPANVAECILQLALHTAHHRGQVATALRTAGVEPPTIDYIAWIWTGRPAPDWNGLA